MAIEKPIDLIRFISGIRVMEDGTIPLNDLESDHEFESRWYKPTYSLSVLGRITQNDLTKGLIEPTDHELDKETIVYQAINSKLADLSPNVYLLLKITVLECFALVYHIDENRRPLTYVSDRDILLIKQNMNYIADYFSTQEDLHFMIESMNNMVIALGYIEHQINLITQEIGGR